MTYQDKSNEFQCLGESEPALIHGRLEDVDAKKGTAIVTAYMDSRIPLRFDAPLEGEMLKLEGKFVKVKGHGWFDDDDEWIAVVVEEIGPPPRPRTIEEIMDDPNPKFFDPDTIPRASEPFDDDNGLGLGEGLCIEDIQRWAAAMRVVDDAVVSLRAAQTDSEIAAAKQRLYLEASRARDHESSAAYHMRRYGYSDGVDVPGVGRFQARRLEDWTAVLERIE